ncbi:hypothetical protein [Hymenobacter crusticola]|uniref:hypothetical protein n=1 Tax=Hymenobacter crusticola TaxID=1770526 RepID=UPI00117A8583|nr:hypothetical protein [Hymenobacter crusticola]
MMTLSQIENFLQLLGFRPDSTPNTYQQDTAQGPVRVRHNSSGSGILIEGPQGLVGGSASHGRHLLAMLAMAGWSVSELPGLN